MRSSLNIAFLLFISAPFAVGDEPSLPPAPEDKAPLNFEVRVDPKVYPPKEFKKESGLKTRPLPEEVREIPSKEFREATFSKVKGLPELVANLDELDRDLLLMRARRMPLKELKKNYPSFPEPVLRSLMAQVKTRAKSR